MVIEYSKCDNCHHKSSQHRSDGGCNVFRCKCPGFKPHGAGS